MSTAPAPDRPAPTAAAPVRWLPVFAAFAIPVAALAVAAVAWLGQQREIRSLQEEVTALRIIDRAGLAQESALRDARDRAARTESELAAARRESSERETAAAAKQAELERVIGFLRTEIEAANETIAALQADREEEPPPPERPARRR